MKNKKFTRAAAISMAAAMMLTCGAQAAPAYIISPTGLDLEDAFDGTGGAPFTTTFKRMIDQISSATIPASYSDNTLANVQRGYINSAKVVIHCVLDTEQKKTWFSGLNTANLVTEDGSGVLGSLKFTTEIKGTDGQVIINAPQEDMLEKTGVYYVLLSSSASDVKVKSTISLVNAGRVPEYPAPEVPKDTSGLSRIIINKMAPFIAGENLSFQIPDMDGMDEEQIGGIEVYLTRPDGKTVKLPKESGYSYTLGIISVYGTDQDSGVVYTPYTGTYQLIVKANGVVAGVKKFRIESGAKVASAQKSSDVQTFDAISTASVGGGGSSGGGGVSSWSGYLVFDEDLLSNALILQQLGLSNSSADKVADQWNKYGMACGSNVVLTEGGDQIYSYTDYQDRAMDASAENKALPFEQYRIGAAYMSGWGIATDGAFKAHFVKSDGTISKGGQYYEYLRGREAPTFTSDKAVTAGEDLVLKCTPYAYDTTDEDEAKQVYTAEHYLKGVHKVFLNSTSALPKDAYAVDPAKGTLTIKGSALKNVTGDLDLRVYAKDTGDAYNRSFVESHTTLQLNRKVGEIVLSAEGEHYVGEDVRITGLTDQFVDLAYSSDRLLNNRYLSGYLRSDNKGKDCRLEDNGKTLVLDQKLFKNPGEYTLKMYADGYDEPVTVTFEVKTDEAHPAPEPAEIPKYKSISLDRSRKTLEVKFPGGYYDNISEEEEDAIKQYTESVYAITVNGTPLKNVGYNDMSDNTFGRSGTNQLNIRAALPEYVNTITVQADGYKDWTFKVDNLGDVTDREPGTEPEVKNAPEISDVRCLVDAEVSFTKGASYIASIKSVTIEGLNGEKWELERDADYIGYTTSGNTLTIKCNKLKADSKYKVTVKADYYNDLELTMRTAVQNSYPSSVEKGWTGADEKVENQEPPAVKAFESDWYDTKLTFNVNEDDRYFYKIASITLNGKELDEADDGKSNCYALEQRWGYIYFSENDFKEGANTIRIVSQDKLYKDLIVTITKSGSDFSVTSTTTEDASTVTDKVAPTVSETGSDDGVLEIYLDGNNNRFYNGLEDASVVLNGKTLSYANNRYSEPEAGQYDYSSRYGYVAINLQDLTEANNVLTIKVAGYETLTVYLDQTGKLIKA